MQYFFFSEPIHQDQRLGSVCQVSPGEAYPVCSRKYFLFQFNFSVSFYKHIYVIFTLVGGLFFYDFNNDSYDYISMSFLIDFMFEILLNLNIETSFHFCL